VAEAARRLRAERARLRQQHDYSLRELYRDTDGPGDHPLDDAQDALDDAVRKTYGMRANADPLRFLFDLNLLLAEKEQRKEAITGPGLPQAFAALANVHSEDAVRMPP
jgi:hypothetical protein